MVPLLSITLALAWAVDQDVDGIDDEVDLCVSAFDPNQGRWPDTGSWIGLQPEIRAVAVGDIDGDGWIDLVAGGDDGEHLVWHRNLGDRLFERHVLPAEHLATQTNNVVLQDLDGDGDLDLFTSHFDGGLQVRLNDGAGFGAATLVHASFRTHAAELVDLDNDGHLDIVALVYSTLGNDFLWMMADGSGGYLPYSIVELDDYYDRISVGDLDEDGFVDVIVGNHDFNLWELVSLNNSAGTGFVAVDLPASSDPVDVALGDIDGDGLTDMVVADAFDGLGVRRRNALGDFEVFQLSVLDYVDAVALTDLDLDGDLDVLFERAASRESFSGLATWSSMGWAENVGGVLRERRSLHPMSEEFGAHSKVEPKVADLDNDGLLDVVSGDHVDGSLVVVWQDLPPVEDSDGDGWCDVDDVAPYDADLDGDGIPDGLELMHFTDPSVADSDGDGVDDGLDPCPADPLDDADGDGMCAPWDGCPSTAQAEPEDDDRDGIGDACDPCDYRHDMNDRDEDGVCDTVDDCIGAGLDGDGDGWCDDVDACLSTPNNPGPPWSNPADDSYGAGSTQPPRLFDMDVDGDLDLVASEHDGTTFKVFVMENDGGVFVNRVDIAVSSTGHLEVDVGDVDGDGDADVVFATKDDPAGWVENLGSLAFASPVHLTSGADPLADVIVLDLDGDGVMEVAGYNDDGVYAIGPVGSQLPERVATGAAFVSDIAAGDIDGDGWADLLVASNDDSDVVWLRSDGSGVGSERYVDAWGIWPEGLATGDFDGDGDLDVASFNPTHVNVMLNVDDGDSWVRLPVLHTGEFPLDLSAHDHDGDGADDLVFTHLDGVFVIPGRPDGPGDPLVARWDTQSAVSLIWGLAGDLDGDGVSDLLVSDGDQIDVHFGGAPPDLDGDLICDGDDPDQDGDGFEAAVDDCDDLDPLVYPGANDDSVDGVDQDCDGVDGPPPADTGTTAGTGSTGETADTGGTPSVADTDTDVDTDTDTDTDTDVHTDTDADTDIPGDPTTTGATTGDPDAKEPGCGCAQAYGAMVVAGPMTALFARRR